MPAAQASPIRPPAPTPGAADVYRLPWVELFATGNHDGDRDWTEDDLDKIIRNYRRYKGKLDPTLVVGHEDDQQLLERTDIPAGGQIGEPRKYWDEEEKVHKIGAPVEGVPPEVADWINRGLYRKGSAEIYDDPQQAGLGAGDGPVLRRFALLGAEIPRVKTINKGGLPKPERAKTLPFAPALKKFSESKRPAKGAGPRRITFFSERRRMDRNQLVQAALQCGIPQSVIDKVDDSELAQLVQAKAAPPAPPPSGAGNFSDDPPMNDPNNPPPAGSYSDPPDPTKPGAPPAPVKCGENDPLDMGNGLGNGQVAKMYAEIISLRRQVAQAQAGFQRVERQISRREQIEAERTKAEHKATVHAFCERWLKEKKVTRAEIDPNGAPSNLYNRLLRLDPTRKVHQFSENGRTVSKSDFELQVADVEQRDPAHLVRLFSEKMPQPDGTQGGQISDARRKELLGKSEIGRAALRLQAQKKAQ